MNSSFKIVIYGAAKRGMWAWLHSFSDGLKRHGMKPVMQHAGKFQGADLAVFWAHRKKEIIERQKKDGNDYMVMERGYFGDRTEWTSIGFNGLNGIAEFYNKDMPPDRWAPHADLMHPWQKDGDYCLIMGQVAGDASIEHVNISEWYNETAIRLKWILERPIKFRPHPLSRQICDVPGAKLLTVSLADALAGACVAVTYNSNSGVDAVLAGVPTVACDKGSMAWPVSRHDISMKNIITYPDRTQWAQNLAYCQWTADEIRDGSAWEHLKQRYE